jgi:kinetochore protein Spc24
MSKHQGFNANILNSTTPPKSLPEESIKTKQLATLPKSRKCSLTKIQPRYVDSLPVYIPQTLTSTQLISNCITNFNIAPDKACLKRTHSALSNLSTARSHLLTRHRTQLTQLTRSLSALNSTHALALQSHNAAQHAADMLRLDTEKFRIAKEASELEIEGERVEKDVGSAKRSLEEIEVVEAAGGVSALPEQLGADETVLKLKVYRMLGIDVEADAETGLYNKAVVRNREKGDVKVVQIDPKFSRYFYADYLWSTL